MLNVYLDQQFYLFYTKVMNSNVYRWCAVPQCSNTSIKTPNKLFINVPLKKEVRNMWLNLARRDPTAISSSSVLYFCEDHFDLPNDMENYMQYHLMGSVSQVRMKSGCIPTRFECQSDNRTSSESSVLHTIEKNQEGPQSRTTCPQSFDKSVQVNIKHKFRSKAVQTKTKLVSQLKSPLKPYSCSIATSPFKIKSCGTTKPVISSSVGQHVKP